MAEAERLPITRLFLRTDSPHLNRTERLGRFVKTARLYSHHDNHFAGFTEAIATCLREPGRKHQQTLSTVLTLKFHVCVLGG